MGKNVYTEIKCHSLLTLDVIVAMVSHKDCIPEVKEVYINFLNHCDNQVTSLFNKPALHLGASKASKIF
jgi:hypothetical protein